MSETLTPSAAPRARIPSPAWLIGGAVMVASLGAGAGWLMRGDASPVPSEPARVAALGPTSAGTSQGDDLAEPPAAAAKKPAPVRAARPAPQSAQRAGTSPLETTRAAVCQDCGVIESVHPVTVKGEANGVGAVAGGVVGAALGNQMGGGNGRKAMTVIGAIGGGMAGHEIEKRARSETVYEVRVRMDDGTLRTVKQKTAPAAGARVVVDGQSLRSVSSGQGEPRTLRTSATGI